MYTVQINPAFSHTVCQSGPELDSFLSVDRNDIRPQMAQDPSEETIVRLLILDKRMRKLPVRNLPRHGRSVFPHHALRHVPVCHHPVLKGS